MSVLNGASELILGCGSAAAASLPAAHAGRFKAIHSFQGGNGGAGTRSFKIKE